MKTEIRNGYIWIRLSSDIDGSIYQDKQTLMYSIELSDGYCTEYTYKSLEAVIRRLKEISKEIKNNTW